MKTKLFSTLLLFVLVGAGCPTPGSTPSETPTSPGTTVSKGCSHPYYPLRPGSSVTYRMTTGEDVNTMKISVKENSGDTAMVNYSFPEVNASIDQTLHCRADGIYSDSFLDLASEVSGMNFRSETKSASGPLLPDDLHVGSEWDNRYDVVVHVDSEPLRAAGITEINQTLSMHRKAVGMESVTVPAGTFNAMKFETHTTVEATGVPGMGSIEFDATEWWVKGIGYVKNESVSNGTTSVIEATEIVK